MMSISAEISEHPDASGCICRVAMILRALIFGIFGLSAASAASAAPGDAAGTLVVPTANGPVQGVFRDFARQSASWWGIRYAEPPVGANRFKEPKARHVAKASRSSKNNATMHHNATIHPHVIVINCKRGLSLNSCHMSKDSNPKLRQQGVYKTVGRRRRTKRRGQRRVWRTKFPPHAYSSQASRLQASGG